MPKKKVTTIRVNEDTWKKLNKLKGHNGCVSMDDVLNWIMKRVNEVRNE